VVDDERTVCEFARQALSSAGYTVLAAAKGSDALTILSTHAIDLIVLDLRLPDTTGVEVMTNARDRGVQAPVIVISGYLGVSEAVSLMKLGASDVLAKPFALSRLLSAVETAIATARQSGWPIRALGVAARLARLILRARDAAVDPRTTGDWARHCGISAGGLRELCRLAGIQPHAARDLARVLRALAAARRNQCRVSVFLDVSDRRTLERLLAAADLSDWEGAVSDEEFLSRQRFVPPTHGLLAHMRAVLAREDVSLR
jgi:FixJ family two-component response regulator